eukprot:CAMPEP_0171114212 /NCGR_PEP_ID=MMETSP0766_2-20121228/84768_1 /TAXON_ID=439317 /ORGANISM="Gambierdiscus australes, Strain CAWD 149" /LENGTH=165 /DNA_ID=CAMNT_0011576493 /DNA_START=25 /DNA_END=522 /DNA_ORIENTATION=+
MGALQAGRGHALQLVQEEGWHWQSAHPSNVSVNIFRDSAEGPQVYLVRENDGTWGPPGGGIDHGESVWDAIQREYMEETREGKQMFRLPHLQHIRKFVYHGHTAIVAGWTTGHVPVGPPPVNPYARRQEILDRQWVPVEQVRVGGVCLRSAARVSLPALLRELRL